MLDTFDARRPGLTLARSLIARALCENPHDAVRYAADTWGTRSTEHVITKAAVGASGRDDLDSFDIAAAAEVEFIAEAARLSVLGRLQGVRRVQPMARYISPSANATGTWVGEGKSIPLSKVDLTAAVLAPLKVATLAVFALEALRAPGADEAVRVDLLRAVAEATDTAFLDFEAAADGTTPAGIAFGATEIASVGDVATDLAATVEAAAAAGIDLTSAAWVMHPATAAAIALALNGVGLASDLGVRGGSLLGVPAFTSQGAGTDSTGYAVHLLDAAGIVIADGGAQFAVSTAGHLSFTDNPPGDVLAPTSNSTSISLFQADCVAFRVTRHVNWARARGAVVLTGADYPGASA